MSDVTVLAQGGILQAADVASIAAGKTTSPPRPRC